MKRTIVLGFVTEVSTLESLQVDVYSIIRIKKLTILKYSEKLLKKIFPKSNHILSAFRYILHINEMEFVSHNDVRIGNPQSYYHDASDIASFSPTISIQYDGQESSDLDLSNNSMMITNINQLTVLGSTKYFHFGFFLVSYSTISIRNSIEGLVTRKSELRIFSNGTGRFFTFDIADLHSEIRCTAFNDVATMFFEVVKADQVIINTTLFFIIINIFP